METNRYKNRNLPPIGMFKKILLLAVVLRHIVQENYLELADIAKKIFMHFLSVLSYCKIMQLHAFQFFYIWTEKNATGFQFELTF